MPTMCDLICLEVCHRHWPWLWHTYEASYTMYVTFHLYLSHVCFFHSNILTLNLAQNYHSSPGARLLYGLKKGVDPTPPGPLSFMLFFERHIPTGQESRRCRKIPPCEHGEKHPRIQYGRHHLA